MPSPASNSPNSLLLLHRHSDSPPRLLEYSTPSNSTSATFSSPLTCLVHKTVIPHRDQALHSLLQDTTCSPCTGYWPCSHLLTALHKQGMTPATIRLYLSAISACHWENRFTDPCKDNPLLTLIKRGITRSSKCLPDQCYPITYTNLRHLIHHLKFDQITSRMSAGPAGQGYHD